MKKFLIFNSIVFMSFIIIFLIGSQMQNYIGYVFAGNSFINPVSSEHYYFTGMILQISSSIGILIQLVFVSKKIIEIK